MPRVGIHASHEQIPPSRLLDAVRAAEAAGFDAAMCSDHFSPWSERQGEESGASPGRGWAPRWSPQPVAGVRQCAGTALPQRSSRRPWRRWRRCTPAASGWRSAAAGTANEHITGAAWPDKATRNARLRECVDVMRALLAGEVVDHHGLVTVDRARLDAARRAAGAGRGGGRRDGGLGRGLGRRARDAQPAARAARARARGVPRRRRRGEAGVPQGPSRGRRAAGALGHRLRPVAHQPLPAADPVGPPHRRGVRRDRALRASRGRALRRCSSPPTSAGTRPGCRTSARSASTRSTCTTWTRRLGPFIDAFGERCSRSCDEEQGDQRPVVEERGPLLPRRRDVPRLGRGRLRRPAQADGAARLPRGAGRLVPVADAALPLPAQGRRLRHLRLLRRRPAARDARRLRRDGAHGARPRHPRDRRPGHEPHLRPAPLFQAAAADRDSPYRDFYVWADEKPPEKPGDVVFPDKEDSNWAWDEEAGQYYLLPTRTSRTSTSPTRRSATRSPRWSGSGCSRGSAASASTPSRFMLEPMGMPGGALVDPHELLRDLRRFMNRRDGEAVLLGEVNLAPEDQRTFFGDEDGDELHTVLVHRQPGDVPRARARAVRAARAGARRAAAIPPGLPVERTSCATTTS